MSGGAGAPARVLARYLVLYDVTPELLGQPRREETTKVEVQEEETVDDDRPEEMETDVVSENRLEGEIARHS